jgi:hypothetical protein
MGQVPRLLALIFGVRDSFASAVLGVVSGRSHLPTTQERRVVHKILDNPTVTAISTISRLQQHCHRSSFQTVELRIELNMAFTIMPTIIEVELRDHLRDTLENTPNNLPHYDEMQLLSQYPHQYD